jgi:hypothetical protein
VSGTAVNWNNSDLLRLVGDLTGDKRVDIVGFGNDGVWVALNSGDGTFGEARFVLANLGFNQGWRTDKHPRLLADLANDRRADIVGFGDDGVWTALNKGDGSFGEARFVLANLGFNQGWRVDQHPRFLADLTGDGRADIVGFGNDGVWVALNSGDGTFGEARFVIADLGFNQGWRVDQHPRFLADLTGDGRADIVGFGNDGVWTALNNGDGSFAAPRLVLAGFNFNQGWRVDKHARLLADLTNNQRADIVGFGDDGVWTALSTGDGSFADAHFVLTNLGFNQGWRPDQHPRFAADLTGDGRADLVAFGNDGVWTSVSNGDGTFGEARFVLANLGFNQGWRVDQHPRFVGHLTGDKRVDIVGFGDDGVWTALSNGDGSFADARFVLADFGLGIRGKAPLHILEIQYKNPDPPSDPNWAASHDRTFPALPSLTVRNFDPEKEWQQVLAPDDEYDQFTLVGASGWMIKPRIAEADVPFTHPFSFDWEFDLALDDPQYTFLLTPGNANSVDDYEDLINRAKNLDIPVPKSALFGVEWDANLVPKSFQDEVNEGDRVAVFGRWILDTGHKFDKTYTGESLNGSYYRTEIHPPLLIAVGSVKPASDGSQITRVLFTSRPYLVGQKFTTDLSSIYDDRAGDDGHFVRHFLNEIGKVNTGRSHLVEAHPKIKSHPFLGAHLLHFVIRPSSSKPGGGNGEVGTFRLATSFHFTVRSGCAVQVASSTSDSVDVFVSLSHAGYVPPALPNRRGHRYSREELTKLNRDVGPAYLEGEAISVAAQLFLGGVIGAAAVGLILERGIETDDYDAPKPVNILDQTNAVNNAFADSIPVGAGVSQDDSQPYPIYGWIEVKWILSAR